MSRNNPAPRARRFLTRRMQAERYSKSIKTIERWGDDPEMKMPPEYNFRGLPHRNEGELEAWERSRVGITTSRRPAARRSSPTRRSSPNAAAASTT